MYKELIETLAKDIEWVRIRPPQTEDAVRRTEEVVGCAFPEELRQLYREMDGDSFCILSLSEIEENVRINRENYLPFFEENVSREAYTDQIERFIFFATDGCGDYYGYRISPDGTVGSTEISIWDHEELGEPDCWKPVASDLKDFIEKYYTDQI